MIGDKSAVEYIEQLFTRALNDDHEEYYDVVGRPSHSWCIFDFKPNAPELDECMGDHIHCVDSPYICYYSVAICNRCFEEYPPGWHFHFGEWCENQDHEKMVTE